MHGVVRRYRGASALGDAMASRGQEVREIIGGVPGFVAYYAVRAGDEVATLTVCEDQAGTQESSRRAAEWVRQNVPGGAPAAPEVVEGEVFVQHGR
jgi:hypothetical protein